MNHKLLFYNPYGVEEYYIYDPDKNEFAGFHRQVGELTPIEPIDGWVSPHLGIGFSRPLTLGISMTHKGILSPAEMQARAEVDLLAERLRELGVEPWKSSLNYLPDRVEQGLATSLNS